MTQNYSERPQETWLEVLHEAPGGSCIVHFNEDITEEVGTGPEGETEMSYSADHYTLETTWRTGLEEAVKANRAAWLAAAIAAAGEKPKTETEQLKEAVASLQQQNADLNSAIDDLTVAFLEGGI